MTGRWRMWGIATRLIAARPLLGWGPGRFAAVYPAFQRASLRSHPPAIAVTDLTNHPHNDYLLLSVEAGLVGLAALLVLLALVLRHAVARGARREAAPLAAALVALAVHGVVDVPLRLPATTVLFCLVVVAVLDDSARLPSVSPRSLSALERLGLVLVMALALVQSARLLLVDRWLQGARHAWVAGRPAEAEQLALRGLRFEPADGELWRSWLALACDSETTMARSRQRARRNGRCPRRKTSTSPPRSSAAAAATSRRSRSCRLSMKPSPAFSARACSSPRRTPKLDGTMRRGRCFWRSSACAPSFPPPTSATCALARPSSSGRSRRRDATRVQERARRADA